MHITSGLSPASGELLDGSTVLHLYDDGVQCGTGYLGEDFNMVPESSHTVEIEYVCEQGAYPNTVYSETDYAVRNIPTQPKFNEEPPNDDHLTDERQSEPPMKKSKVASPTSLDGNDPGEPDLTNLTWLQNITNIMSVPTFPIAPVSPTPPTKPPPVQNTRLQKFNKTMEKCLDDFTDNKDEYRTKQEMKPQYSYSTLICMAMRYNGNKMTLSAIYSWIRDNFKYYRNADPTWQNSIRHNLSLNKVFVKVARSKQEPGKGGFWKLDLTRLEDNKQGCSRPHKKKKPVADAAAAVPVVPRNEEVRKEAEPSMGYLDPDNIDVRKDVEIGEEYPELNIGTLHPICKEPLGREIGANVIVEPAVPPPLMAEDDLTSMLLDPTEWDDLQLDMLDSYLDSCFK